MLCCEHPEARNALFRSILASSGSASSTCSMRCYVTAELLNPACAHLLSGLTHEGLRARRCALHASHVQRGLLVVFGET